MGKRKQFCNYCMDLLEIPMLKYCKHCDEYYCNDCVKKHLDFKPLSKEEEGDGFYS